MNEKQVKVKLTPFDPDFTPGNPHNKKAAGERGWRYDRKCRVYRDSDGCLMADRYGQPLG